MGWTPVFEQIVDSSVWREGDNVLRVFLTMLAKKRSDHVVYGSAFNIGSWAFPGRPTAEVDALEALRVLSSPDTRRVEPQEFDGRRIQKVEGGWLVLNGAKYEQLMRDESRRIYKARKQREYRDKEESLKKSRPLPGDAAALLARSNGHHDVADAIAAERKPL